MTEQAAPREPEAEARPFLPQGFSLIEVMMAGTIFLGALAGTITGISAATQAYQHQRRTTAALAVTETVMEELLLLQSSDANISAGGPAHERFYDLDGNVDPSGRFRAVWVVTADSPVAGMREIVLRVEWQERNGHTRSLFVSTVRR